jgi:hypothetical protein
VSPACSGTPAARSYALVWCDARSVAGGEIWLQFLDANAALIGAARRVLSSSAGQRMRRPRLFCHPDNGYVLLWEDDSQNSHFDVYLAFLDAAGGVDNRLAVAADDVLTVVCCGSPILPAIATALPRWPTPRD